MADPDAPAHQPTAPGAPVRLTDRRDPLRPARTSIVMANHNRGAYLEAAARSVLAQTDGDLELILWDDGSTDDSAQIAGRLADEDARVVFASAGHGGLGRAMLGAHALARGELVGWVDSDDLLMAHAVARCAGELLARPGVGMVYSDHYAMSAQGQVMGLGHRCRVPYSAQGLLVSFMTFHFRLVRRALMERVGGIDAGLEMAWDYDLCLRLSEAAGVTHLREPLYMYRVHAGSVSETRRAEQVAHAKRAVEAALVRRGMAPSTRVEVDSHGVFRLVTSDKGPAV